MKALMSLFLLTACAKGFDASPPPSEAGILEYDSLSYWTAEGPTLAAWVEGDFFHANAEEPLRLVTDGLVYRSIPPQIRVRLIYGGENYTSWSLVPLQAVDDSLVMLRYEGTMIPYQW